MNITIDNIIVDCWDSGYPYWFHIQEGDQQINFTHREVTAIIRALELCRQKAMSKMSQKEKDETYLRS